MTGRTVVLDTWAWFEVLDGTPRGAVVAKRYLADESVRIVTVDISLAEASAVLQERGHAERIPAVLDDIIAASDEVVPITRDDAIRAGPLRAELRKASKDASLADALLLAIARNRNAALISSDPAFQGQPDVIRVRADAQGS